MIVFFLIPKEDFDLLDENGNKTGKTKLRTEVHRNGDWHKAVHIWIINNKGDVLLQRRCATKDSDSNMLDISSAGHLSVGDDSLTGAIRELKEELNLDVNKEELLKKYAAINNETSISKGIALAEGDNDININKLLEKATLDFFSKIGQWYRKCFKRLQDLDIQIYLVI